VTAQVDAVVYFRIQDPVASVLQAENARNSTYRVAQGTLRDVLGTKSLAEILSDREEISDHMGVGLEERYAALTLSPVRILMFETCSCITEVCRLKFSSNCISYCSSLHR
jgi:regulator of protease activity HflC (stomatin/prohibitin superfamily)